jgi:hypothetical protein
MVFFRPTHSQDQGLRLYRLCLYLYPSQFRKMYGGEMTVLFRDCLRDAHREGTGGLSRLWLRTVVDIGVSVPHAHLEEWTAMQASYTRSSQFGAICAFVAVVLWILVFSVGDTFATYGNMLAGLLVLGGMAATIGAVAGLYFRLTATDPSPFPRWGAVSGLLGVVVLAGGVIVTLLNPDNPWGWYAFMSALGLLALALGLMGVSSSRQPSLGPLRFAPLLVLGVPVLVFIILFFYASTGDEVGRQITVVTLSLAMVGILGTGALLWTKSK